MRLKKAYISKTTEENLKNEYALESTRTGDSIGVKKNRKKSKLDLLHFV